MNSTSRSYHPIRRFIGRLLSVGLTVGMLGIVSTPARAGVTVDQAPLIIKQTLPPNVMLMLDDSGSMAWDIMPDYDFITDQSTEGFINSNVNGLYYNPDITYSPPVKADGSSYADASFSNAWINGFDTSSTKVDLSSYDGSYDSSRINHGSSVQYSIKFSSGDYYSADSCSTYGTAGYSTAHPGYCYFRPQDGRSYEFIDNGYYYVYRCHNSADTLDNRNTDYYGDDRCYPEVGFFTYTTTDSGGNYIRHYVGKTAGDCAKASLAADVCVDDNDAIRKNVANWFSYYHTRILMAKTGLMKAFLGIDAAYRIGFGSINNNNSGGVTDTGYYQTFNNKKIAMVLPFGDGSAGTQKADFWSWLVDERASSSTPLRYALDALGQYYQGQQPWLLDPKVKADPDTNELDAVDSTTNPEYACRQSYTILTTDGFWNGSNPNVGDVDGANGPAIQGSNEQSDQYIVHAPYADGQVTTTITQYNPTPECNSGDTYSGGQCKHGVDGPYYYTGHGRYKNKCNRGDTYLYSGPHAGQCEGTTTSYTYYDPTYKCDGTDPLDQSTGTCSKTVTEPAASYPNTLADVAMKYWDTDLRPNTNNEVPASEEDPAFWQHMTTFTLGLGFKPQYSDGSDIDMTAVFKWANGGNPITNFTWPEPVHDQLSTIADLAHAAVNGHGGFYSAKTPEAFTDGIKGALQRAAQRVGTGASLAANSTQLKTGTVAYQANYYTVSWKGDLKAFNVNSGTGAISSTPNWTAAGSLPAAADRNIYTYNPSGNADGEKFVPFSDVGDLSATEKTSLGGSSAQDIINYLRGDDSKEQKYDGGIYRNRETALGDIVDSQPVYVGAPEPNQYVSEVFTGSSTYATFAADKADRTQLIFVAANDGMLHAFNATTGVETFAFVPGAVINSGLSSLANTAYGDTIGHKFFNDGELTIADVYFKTDEAWHTVLVGTTGKGLAKAIYAFDVTDTDDIKFLWERSAADGKVNSDYMGQLIGKPVIAQTADGVWSVLISNGFNSTRDVAALLQFNLTDGALTVHATDNTSSNGLGAPAVWIGDLSNGISTAAYAGDRYGRVWSFVLNDGTDAKPSSTGTALFTAKDKDNNVQPITGGMLAGKDPTTGNLWVFFGTGEYLSIADLTDYKTQSWYGLIVKSTTSGLAITNSDTRSSSLVKREIVAEVAAKSVDLTATPPVTVATSPARAITPAAGATSLTGKSGWYLDLTSPLNGAEGERIVTPNIFQGNQLIATTRIPQAADVCNPSGRGWIMSIDPFTGTAPQSSFFDIDGNGTIDTNDMFVAADGKTYVNAGIGFSSLPNNPIFVGGIMLVSFDNGSTSSIFTQGSGGAISRVSWREMINQ